MKSKYDEQNKQLQTQDSKIKYIYTAIQAGTLPPLPKEPVFAGQHHGFSDFNNFQSTQVGQAFMSSSGPSFFDGVCFPMTQFTTPLYEQSMHPQYPVSFTPTSYTANHMTQELGHWSSTYQANVDPTSVVRPSHTPNVGGVNPDAMNRQRRECRPGIFQRSPYTVLPDTTVIPQKRGARTNKNTATHQISRFELGNEVERKLEDYVSFKQFIKDPFPIYIDCHVKGSWVMPQFWQELIPYAYKSGTDPGPDPLKIGWLSDELLIHIRPRDASWTVAKAATTTILKTETGLVPVLTFDNPIRGTLTGSTRPYPSWDNIEWVVMPVHICGDHWVTAFMNLRESTFNVHDSMESFVHKDALVKFLYGWNNVLNYCLTKLGYFERTQRQPFNFALNYNNYRYLIPQQKNGADCGVIMCWLITQFVLNRWPPVFDSKDVEKFFTRFRLHMAEKFYERHCESTSDCGYDIL